MKFNKNKKGIAQVPGILTALLTVVVIVAVIGLVMLYTGAIVEDVQDDYVTGVAGCNETVTTGCGTAYDIADNALDNSADLSDKQSSITGVTIAGFIIAILLAAFGAFLFRR